MNAFVLNFNFNFSISDHKDVLNESIIEEYIVRLFKVSSMT